MSKALMVLGTTSDAGKSLTVAALCRIYSNRGYKVAPFKAQNMGSNTFITKGDFEISRAQAVQAEAARIEADFRMNPVLLKPMGDSKSQVVVNGSHYKDLSAQDYYEEKEKIFPQVLASYRALEEDYDIIFLEGAGSPSEINLKEVDIVNMGLAKALGVPCIIVGDIDKGGVFASLAGTLLLFDEEERELTKGVLINKFRGDQSILDPGLRQLEDIIQKPVLGVVPYLDVDIEDEDSLAQRMKVKDPKKALDIAVIRLPHIGNFTDTHVFSLHDLASVRYIHRARDFGQPDLVIIPGSQNLEEDLLWLRESGLDAKLKNARDKGCPIVALGKGYPILAKTIQAEKKLQGLGLLDLDLSIEEKNKTWKREGVLDLKEGPWKKLDQLKVQGYWQEKIESHLGSSAQAINLSGETIGAVKGNVLGVSCHGFFDNREVHQALMEVLAKKKGLDLKPGEDIDLAAYKDQQYEKLARGVEASLDMDLLDQILGLK
ncbi:MAG: cobyric acid synthase [Tissierellia bacterium]|nr:cobyric acid synthase [Tissierellia bacterium]